MAHFRRQEETPRGRVGKRRREIRGGAWQGAALHLRARGNVDERRRRAVTAELSHKKMLRRAQEARAPRPRHVSSVTD